LYASEHQVCVVSACFQIYTYFIEANPPGTFDAVKHSHIFMMLAQLIMTGHQSSQISAVRLIRFAFENGRQYAQCFIDNAVPISDILNLTKHGTAVARDALDCISEIMKMTDEFAHEVLYDFRLLRIVLSRWNSSAKYHDHISYSRAFLACIPRISVSMEDPAPFDIARFIEVALNGIEKGDFCLSSNLIGGLSELFKILDSHGIAGDWCWPVFDARHGTEVIEENCLDDLELCEPAAVFLRLIHENRTVL
jgi:hypothetical protein